MTRSDKGDRRIEIDLVVRFYKPLHALNSLADILRMELGFVRRALHRLIQL